MVYASMLLSMEVEGFSGKQGPFDKIAIFTLYYSINFSWCQVNSLLRMITYLSPGFKQINHKFDIKFVLKHVFERSPISISTLECLRGRREHFLPKKVNDFIRSIKMNSGLRLPWSPKPQSRWSWSWNERIPMYYQKRSL